MHDSLILVQLPDIHDNTHPHMLSVKVYAIEGPKLFYRVDPQKDTHKFVSGAVIIKKFEEDLCYKVVGLHLGRTEKVHGKRIQWCHHGILLTYCFKRLRQDITERMEHDQEASQVEEKVGAANYRKISMLAAKRDLDSLIKSAATSDHARKQSIMQIGT